MLESDREIIINRAITLATLFLSLNFILSVVLTDIEDKKRKNRLTKIILTM